MIEGVEGEERTFYVTRHALSLGILKIRGVLVQSNGTTYVRPTKTRRHAGALYKTCECFTTEADARAVSDAMIFKRIESLEGQIAGLKKLKSGSGIKVVDWSGGDEAAT